MKYYQFCALFLLLLACKDQNVSKTTNTVAEPEINNNVSVADTTPELMNENVFWQIIDKSRARAIGDYQAQISMLKLDLLERDPSEVIKFNNTFTSLLALSYDWRLWGASYVINGGCSDDCFEYFREYLIGHGKEKFYQTLKDPESCASWIKSEEEDNWEGLHGAVFAAYKQKTGKDLPLNMDIKFELKGKAFDEEKVDRQYPKLAKKFNSEG